MTNSDRRDFVKAILGSTSALAGAAWLAGLGYAQSNGGPAQVVVNSARRRAAMDPRLMGAFLEHLGRAIYGGVYEPGSPLSDSSGFRADVVREMQALKCPIMRYPGGNFVSGYDWLHGVGPKQDRPAVLERAWNSIETNQFGTNEFIDWCKLVGTEPLLATNLGTGTPETSAALVEYCNIEKGTRWSELRRDHGYERPHNVKTWCLGNEMDGSWQIGHMPAREYGRKARDAARQIRSIAPSTELIACGSSAPFMPTYLVWDRETLEECYPEIDGLSLHRYYGNTEEETGGDSARFLALNLDMDLQIQETIAVCDYVRGLVKSPKRLRQIQCLGRRAGRRIVQGAGVVWTGDNAPSGQGGSARWGGQRSSCAGGWQLHGARQAWRGPGRPADQPGRGRGCRRFSRGAGRRPGSGSSAVAPCAV